MPGKTVKQISSSVENTISEPVQTSPPVTQKNNKKNTKTQETSSAPVQKGGKKNTPVVSATEPVVSATEPVVSATEPVVSEPVVSEPVVSASATKRGGARKTKISTESSPIVESDVVIPAPKKKRIVKSKVEESVTESSGKTKPKKETKTKKVNIPKQNALGDVTTLPSELEDSNDRKVRSFKVKLPDKEDFEGRFTGLTPYQAANKALSKYFRETENPKVEITFLICESTRKSKKSVYTYVGKRYQLEVPVKYTIQDGREIVKNFKNSLKKVKKVDLIDQAGGTSTPVVLATA